MSRDKKFTTIKIREQLRRWLKLEAARHDVPMYVIVERMVAKGARGRPWEKEAT